MLYKCSQCYKTFFFASAEEEHYARVFILGKLFQASLLFTSKAVDYQSLLVLDEA